MTLWYLFFGEPVIKNGLQVLSIWGGDLALLCALVAVDPLSASSYDCILKFNHE